MSTVQLEDNGIDAITWLCCSRCSHIESLSERLLSQFTLGIFIAFAHVFDMQSLYTGLSTVSRNTPLIFKAGVSSTSSNLPETSGQCYALSRCILAKYLSTNYLVRFKVLQILECK